MLAIRSSAIWMRPMHGRVLHINSIVCTLSRGSISNRGQTKPVLSRLPKVDRTSYTKHVPKGDGSIGKVTEGKYGGKRGTGRNLESRLQQVVYLAWAICVVHCIKQHVLETAYVRGPSMQPTIEDNSVLLVNKVCSTFRRPKQSRDLITPHYRPSILAVRSRLRALSILYLV